MVVSENEAKLLKVTVDKFLSNDITAEVQQHY